jgi:hypothetical protein
MNRSKYGKLLLLLETIHIPLWLVKDLCWLLSYRLLGVMVAIPTIIVAFVMAVVTRGDRERFLPNISVALWILANANWMVAEFYDWDIKHYSLYPFVGGLLVFTFFLIQKLVKSDKVRHI